MIILDNCRSVILIWLLEKVCLFPCREYSNDNHVTLCNQDPETSTNILVSSIATAVSSTDTSTTDGAGQTRPPLPPIRNWTSAPTGPSSPWSPTCLSCLKCFSEESRKLLHQYLLIQNFQTTLPWRNGLILPFCVQNKHKSKP